MKQEELKNELPEGVTITERAMKENPGYQAYKKSFDDAMKETIADIESRGKKAFIMRKRVKLELVTPGEGEQGRRKAIKKQIVEHFKPLVLWVDHASTTVGRINKYETKGWSLAWTNLTLQDVPPKDERLNELIGVIQRLSTAKTSQELTEKYMNTAKEKYEQRAKKA